jgi:hypothetical protein
VFLSNPVFNNLAEGTYNVIVRNINGCLSLSTLVIINKFSKAGIYHTTTSCSDFMNGRGTRVNQICYASNNGLITNAVPGKIYYYTKLVAPSSSFCVEVKQNKSLSNFNIMSIHQNNQIVLMDANCNRLANGETITVGNGKVCINNAIAGRTYVLSVKFDPKSLIGTQFSGAAPDCQYGFSSFIDGNVIPGSQTSITAKPNCDEEDDEDHWTPTINNNPTTSCFALNVNTDNDNDISVQVSDVVGRVISRFTMPANAQTNYGDNLFRGVYFIEFKQGEKRKVMKAVKL